MRKRLNKALALILSLALLVLLTPVFAPAAHALQSGAFTYAVADGKATITGYSGSGTAVAIPPKLGGYPVAAIGNFAFAGRTKLKSIKIPEGVTYIGQWGFSGCSALASVAFPESLETIDRWAFSGCEMLTSVTLPKNVSNIGDGVFGGESLRWIYVESSNTHFLSVDGVLLSYDKTRLYQYPAGNARKSYTLPAAVASITLTALNGSVHLNNIGVQEGSTTFESADGVLYNKGRTELVQYPLGNTRKSYTIPDGVTIIDFKAFGGCMALTNVALPDSLVYIGNYSFENTGLKSLKLPESVKYIGYGAFVSCQGLRSVTIPAGVTDILDEAFGDCHALQRAVFQNGVPKNINGESIFAHAESYFKILYPRGAKGWSSPKWFGYRAQAYDYIVTYDPQKGSFVPCEGVLKNARISAPSVPSRRGYVFGGWYKEPACTHAWNFSRDTVTADTTLYAKWMCAISATVNRTSWGTVTGAGNYRPGTTAALKAIPKAGCRFVRWMEGTSQVSTEAKYSFSVTKSRSLKAEFAVIGKPALSAAPAGYGSIRLAWKPVAGAAGYEVWRAVSKGGTYKSLKAVNNAAAYTDTGLVPGRTYYYKVRAYCRAGTAKTYGGFSPVKYAKPGT